MDQSRKEDICVLLDRIRQSNPGREIAVILGNFASYRSAEVRKRALELQIGLVFLPPYSPDLNAIDFL